MVDSQRILLADDEETFLYSTADLLRQDGYQCDCVKDADAAVRMLQSVSYDLLISDIRMPGNLGLEFIRDLPKITRTIPVILVTGYPSLNTAIESAQLPVVSYIVKPLDYDHLLGSVRTALQRSSALRVMSATAGQLERWREELGQLEQAAGEPRIYGSTVVTGTFIELTVRHIMQSLLDLQQLLALADGRQAESMPCHLLKCPRPPVLLDTIREVIEVLEKTKGSFKSKELGALRQKLEQIIKEAS